MEKNKHYAGLLGITIGDIFRRGAGRFIEKETFHGRQVIYTHKGRSGLGLLCHHWNLQAEHEILVPAYNCGTEIDPFVQYGLKVIFYRVNHQAQIDLEDLLHRVTARTRVIYITHYFGWPQNTQFLSKFCRDNNIHLLEDCALSLFSNPVDSPIGLLGDAAIYSLSKTLPVPDGGALTMAERGLVIKAIPEPPSAKNIFKKMLPLIKRTVLRFSDRAGFYRYLPSRLVQSRNREMKVPATLGGLPDIPRSYYFDKAIESKSASKIARHILKHSSPEHIVEQRRSNFAQLFEVANNSRIFQPLFHHLPEGVCPLFLSVIVADRETVCRRLNDKGVAAMQWWAGYHQAFDWSEFPEARCLKDHVLAIPIHQQLSPEDVRYICSVLLSVSNGQS